MKIANVFISIFLIFLTGLLLGLFIYSIEKDLSPLQAIGLTLGLIISTTLVVSWFSFFHGDLEEFLDHFK